MAKHQTGSAHVIIIVILVIALIGAVGYIAWNNLTKNTETVATTTDQDDNTTGNEASQAEDWKTYTSDKSSYSIQYPSDWLVVAETNDDGAYIRNEEPVPTDKGGHTGYQDGFTYLRVIKSTGNQFEHQGLSEKEWYAALGKETVQFGPVDIAASEVSTTTVNGQSAKRFITAFTETNETFVVQKGSALYFIHVYPEHGTDDATLNKILNSFTIK